MSAKLKIYGHPMSQPTRAVLWALKIKNVPFEFQQIELIKKEQEGDEYLAKFPMGVVPGLEELDTGFKLSESNAILTYLAEKYQWNDWYPTDVEQRARVNEWLHWHHSNSRLMTDHLFRPTMMNTVTGKPVFDIEANRVKGLEALRVISLVTKYNAFNKHKFLAGDGVTIADIVTYCEFDGLDAIGVVDLAKEAPEVYEWMQRMKQLPQHDEVRVALFKTAEMIKAAKA